jgi:hypothetical protein
MFMWVPVAILELPHLFIYLFSDSLSRESYVTMIVCISPSSLDVVQTATTLKFAEEAKKIMSKPRLKELLDNYKVIKCIPF